VARLGQNLTTHIKITLRGREGKEFMTWIQVIITKENKQLVSATTLERKLPIGVSPLATKRTFRSRESFESYFSSEADAQEYVSSVWAFHEEQAEKFKKYLRPFGGFFSRKKTGRK